MGLAAKVIGVRQLKAELSAQLRRVEAGESLVVTDRGRPIATLSPIVKTDAPAWMMTLIAEGRATWGGGKPAGLAKRIPSRGKLASVMVLEDRR